MSGCFIMLGICNMLVPIPCEISPPTPFSLNDITAKPTICAAHPTTAAPPASIIASDVLPDAIAIHIAADEVGIVKSMPITTDITTPIIKGCAVTEISMNF